MLNDKETIIHLTKYQYKYGKTLGLIKTINGKECIYGFEFKIIEEVNKNVL